MKKKDRISTVLIVPILALGAGITANAADFRPDLLIGDSREELKGDNQFLGGGQKIRLQTEGTTKFFVQVENDGDLDDTIKLRGRKGNRHWDVQYFDESNGDANITGQLIRGNFVTGLLATGEGILIRGEVERINRRAKRGKGKGGGGKRRHFKVRGHSVNDPSARDIVRAFVKSGKKPKRGGKPEKGGKPNKG